MGPTQHRGSTDTYFWAGQGFLLQAKLGVNTDCKGESRNNVIVNVSPTITTHEEE
jgi:hypothetical protein